jgi:hypothetical protein
MEISDEDKRQILNGFIDIFTRIASKEYQKRIWVDGEGPEVDDFDNTVNDFFVECDSILENYKDFGITENQYLILKKFRDRFRNFSNENNWPQEFIDTPEWEKITKMAQEILKAFNYNKVRR